MNFEQEQKILKEFITYLNLFATQNINMQMMRDSVEVSNQDVQNALYARQIIKRGREEIKTQIRNLMGSLEEIIKADGEIRGFDYFESKQIETKLKRKQCQHCNKEFEYKSLKKKFCSNACKTAYSRNKKEVAA